MSLGPAGASDELRRALALTPSSTARERTVDITTTGRRSGQPRRIEVWFYREGDENYLSGTPGPRAWVSNLRADPDFTFHLKHGPVTDLPARAVFVDDEAERRRVFSRFVDDLNQPANPGRIRQPTRLEDWLAGSPLVRVEWR